MAGDWIKMRTDLADDPAVIGIAEATGLDEDAVVGKLWKLWSWADQQTIDGCAPSVTRAFLDRHVNVTGFAQAMVDVGWLVVNDSREGGGGKGITFPNFDRHNGQTAKQRALAAKRMSKSRGSKCNGLIVTEPQPEKRREEKNINTPLPPLLESKEEAVAEARPTARSNLPCDNPELFPIVRRVIDYYRKTVGCPHAQRPEWATAVTERLNGGLSEEQLKKTIDQYAKKCDREKTLPHHRVGVSTFFAANGTVEEFLTAPLDYTSLSPPEIWAAVKGMTQDARGEVFKTLNPELLAQVHEVRKAER